jgi:hypothetical protein
MKKFSLALVALAMASAISTSAWATTACSATSGAITTSTVCSEGNFTFTFDYVSLGANSDIVFFGAGTTGSGNSADLLFQIAGGPGNTGAVLPEDIDLVYEVQGPAGPTTLDNSFVGASSITETACSGPFSSPTVCTGTTLANFYNGTSGVTDTSNSFSQNGTFYISKDAEATTFSEFEDSVNVAPEPSSLVLFGTGLLGLAFVAFRKAKSSGATLSI